MKSPVYGMQRNYKHRPTNAILHRSAGDINMKGKKRKRMSCRCCFCIDYREEVRDKVHYNEIREHM